MTTPRKRAAAKGGPAARGRKAQAARSATAPSSLERVERRGKVLRLRNGGATLTQIAEALNISTATVQRDIALAVRDTLQVPVEHYVAASISRMEDIRRAMWPAMLKGDTKSADTLIKLEQRQATLLGLDAPTRVVLGAGAEDYAATLAGLMVEMGVTPPPTLARALDAATDAAPPPGPPAVNEGVPQDIVDADYEVVESDPWV